jgi:5-methylcytosine-specific restriction endonuclease McrA
MIFFDYINLIKARMGCGNSAKEEYHKEHISKALRDEVWEKYHGNKDTGKCYCCGAKINRYHGQWHAGHVRAEVKSGPTTLENLRTCCPHCNLSMNDQNLYAYIRDKDLHGPGRKNVDRYFKHHKSQIHDKRTNNYNKK